ncbi:MAG: helix-turn-helix transcriptional regulator [Mycobacteriaceae bacterium]
MAISKVERLMNLVICLLSSSQYLTAERIRASVAGYEDSASDEAFSRMFERDKNELRDLGVPLETGKVSRLSSADGYRINRNSYELPDIDLSSDEAACVAIAVQLWESPELSAAAQSALLKLRAAGVELDTNIAESVATATPRSRGSEVVLSAILEAINSSKIVQFQHRASQVDPYLKRTVEPWGVVTNRGRWYLVGYDLDRAATRTFRLSRINDEVTICDSQTSSQKPPDIDLRAVVARAVGEHTVSGSALIWIAQGRAQELRRLGTYLGPKKLQSIDGCLYQLEVRSWDWVARIIAGHANNVVVLEPDSLRNNVIERFHAFIGQEQL